MERGSTVKLADYCSNFSYRNLNEELIKQAKKLILDFLGVCLAGFKTKPSRIISKYVESIKGPREAVLIGKRDKTLALYAALVNGTTAHCLELDDGHKSAMGHPGSAVIPAALATAENYDVSGKGLITSVVIGYEAMLKTAMAIAPSHRERHFHPTATCGGFGAAAAVGNILGLGNQKMASALGLAGTQASGLFEFLAKGSMIKRFHPGKAAFNGFLSAELASRGFDGPDTILEGKDGFLRAFSDDFDVSHFDDLGKPFEIMNVYCKPYASCRHGHAAIDAVKSLMEREDLKVNEIRSVKVKTYKAASYHDKKNIKKLLDAQMSIPYGLAVTLISGDAKLDRFKPPWINDSKVRDLMKRTSVEFDEEMEAKFPQTRATKVSIKTSDAEFERYIEYPKGSPENPLSEDDLIEKFVGLTSDFMEKGDRKILIDKVLGLEKLDSVAELEQYLIRRN